MSRPLTAPSAEDLLRETLLWIDGTREERMTSVYSTNYGLINAIKTYLGIPCDDGDPG